MTQTRSLIVIPIIHTKADFGSLQGKIPVDAEIAKMSQQYWDNILHYIQNLSVDFSQLRVYQDGLPDASVGQLTRIVNQAQTPNYNVLRLLRKKGAHILGTESERLLMEEYYSQHAIFNPVDEESYIDARLAYENRKWSLLEERDVYIAQRINNTLPEGGIGILFIGLGHQVQILLDREISVSEPEGLIGSSSEVLRKNCFGQERE
ncbi:MAG: hypothetical protein Q7R97_00185 [Candidatus Daviesbacteria bacterium]|nr:hypothetical protein [Candidatus Daviesbacteria bacterium]